MGKYVTDLGSVKGDDPIFSRMYITAWHMCPQRRKTNQSANGESNHDDTSTSGYSEASNDN